MGEVFQAEDAAGVCCASLKDIRANDCSIVRMVGAVGKGTKGSRGGRGSESKWNGKTL